MTQYLARGYQGLHIKQANKQILEQGLLWMQFIRSMASQVAGTLQKIKTVYSTLCYFQYTN